MTDRDSKIAFSASSSASHFVDSAPVRETLPEVVVESVPLTKGKLIPRKPFRVQPYIEDGLYIAEYEPVNLAVYEETWDMVIPTIHEQLAVFWEQYAQADDAKLTKGAQALKARLHEHFIDALC